MYYLYNAHGDVVQVLNSSGEVTKTYNYDAYGNELTRDLNDSNPFRYCGEYYDTETGFIYLRARYYNPNTGRFISVDPIKDGQNWYSYCNNNPVSHVDPMGLRPKDLSPQAAAVCLDGGGGTVAKTPPKAPSKALAKTPSKTSTNLAKKTDLASKSAAQVFGQASQKISAANTYNHEVYVVDYDGSKEGLYVVGHARIYFQNNEGNWFMTEFTTEFDDGDSLLDMKNNAQLYCHNEAESSYHYNKDMKAYEEGYTDYVELSGDFSECVKLSKKYEATGYKPKYNLFERNCTDYVQDLLSVAKIDNWGVNFAVKCLNPKTPAIYLWFIKLANTGT